MTAAEIEHYANRLAALTVTAARATSPGQLSEIHVLLLEETFAEALTLLAHDGETAAERLARDLLERVQQRPSAPVGLRT